MFDPSATSSSNANYDSGFEGANNFISVPDGMSENPFVDPVLPPWVPNSGTIPAGTLPFSVAHEFGHLLGLFDVNFGNGLILPWRDPSDIMAEGSKVTQYDINRIIPAKANCKCK